MNYIHFFFHYLAEFELLHLELALFFALDLAFELFFALDLALFLALFFALFLALLILLHHLLLLSTKLKSKYIKLSGDNMQFLPIVFTIVAGFSTMLGLLFLYLPTKKVGKVVSSCLCFSSGVIISICLLDLIPQSTLVVFEESRSRVITFIFLILFFYLDIF